MVSSTYVDDLFFVLLWGPINTITGVASSRTTFSFSKLLDHHYPFHTVVARMQSNKIDFGVTAIYFAAQSIFSHESCQCRGLRKRYWPLPHHRRCVSQPFLSSQESSRTSLGGWTSFYLCRTSIFGVYCFHRIRGRDAFSLCRSWDCNQQKTPMFHVERVVKCEDVLFLISTHFAQQKHALSSKGLIIMEDSPERGPGRVLQYCRSSLGKQATLTRYCWQINCGRKKYDTTLYNDCHLYLFYVLFGWGSEQLFKFFALHCSLRFACLLACLFVCLFFSFMKTNHSFWVIVQSLIQYYRQPFDPLHY